MEMEKIIKSIYENYAGDLGRGKVADYIPPLAKYLRTNMPFLYVR